jgi:hypothetical protein
MYFKLKTGTIPNVPTAEYYAESDEELELFEDVVPGSVGMILTESGLKIKMYHSSGKWIEV